MYMINEEDIISWARYNSLEFIRCACRFTEMVENTDEDIETASKRKEIKLLIKELKKTNPLIEQSIFNSIHSVCLDTLIGYKKNGEYHSFLDNY